MPIDLTYPSDVQKVVDATRSFVRETVLPIEDQFFGNVDDAGGDEWRQKIQQEARLAGVFAPHAPIAYGGLGLDMSDRVPVFEEAGYSLFGPMALNIAAPDEGNVHLLAHVASEAQK